MNSIDLAILDKSTIGFDQMLADLQDVLTNDSLVAERPPYNIESLEDSMYSLTLSVPGFSESELSIELESNKLMITGQEQSSKQKNYLYKGFSSESFKCEFSLASFTEVHSANLENGLLTICLKRNIPEEMRPRKIPIGSTNRISKNANRRKTRKAA